LRPLFIATASHFRYSKHVIKGSTDIAMTRHEIDQGCGPEVRVCTLPHAERLVVWAARAWIDAHCAGRFPCRRLQSLFQHLNLQDCIGPFYSLFTFLAHEASRDLDFRCPACGTLGDDERRLLALFAACQQGAARTADVILQDWLPDGMAERAAYPARLVANGLAESGLRLRGALPPRLQELPRQPLAH
jgi:hypothetical protein